MRSPPPLVLSGQSMAFEAGIDPAPLNMVPAHHYMHPQLIYHPQYVRDPMGTFIPPSKIIILSLSFLKRLKILIILFNFIF